MENRLNAPLPNEVFVRFYVEHPDKALATGHEHLQGVVDAGRELARQQAVESEPEAVQYPAKLFSATPNGTESQSLTDGQLQFDTDPPGIRPE